MFYVDCIPCTSTTIYDSKEGLRRWPGHRRLAMEDDRRPGGDGWICIDKCTRNLTPVGYCWTGSSLIESTYSTHAVGRHGSTNDIVTNGFGICSSMTPTSVVGWSPIPDSSPGQHLGVCALMILWGCTVTAAVFPTAAAAREEIETQKLMPDPMVQLPIEDEVAESARCVRIYA